MNAEDYWFPWFPSVFRSNTLHLTPEQDGLYRRLIDHYMESRAPLPDNDIALARICGVPVECFSNAASIVKAFFKHKNGVLHHEFCDERLDEQDGKSKKRSDRAKKAAQKRWAARTGNKGKNANGIADAMLGDATGQDRTGEDSTSNEVESPKRTPKASGSDVDLQLFVDMYNQMAGKTGLPECQTLSDARRKALQARLKECGGLDGWKVVMEIVAASDFLTGRKKDWKASFDFILQKSSFIKIMEGQYNNHKPQVTGGRSYFDEILETAKQNDAKFREESHDHSPYDDVRV